MYDTLEKRLTAAEDRLMQTLVALVVFVVTHLKRF